MEKKEWVALGSYYIWRSSQMIKSLLGAMPWTAQKQVREGGASGWRPEMKWNTKGMLKEGVQGCQRGKEEAQVGRGIQRQRHTERKNFLMNSIITSVPGHRCSVKKPSHLLLWRGIPAPEKGRDEDRQATSRDHHLSPRSKAHKLTEHLRNDCVLLSSERGGKATLPLKARSARERGTYNHVLTSPTWSLRETRRLILWPKDQYCPWRNRRDERTLCTWWGFAERSPKAPS